MTVTFVHVGLLLELEFKLKGDPGDKLYNPLNSFVLRGCWS